jgi:hypothetical protein
MWSWLPFRRRRIGIPEALWRTAQAPVPYLATLGADDQRRLHDMVRWFLQDKRFEGAGGLQITDSMCVEVAVQACLLILNLGPDYYHGWQTVIVYPGDFLVPKEVVDEAGVVHQWTEPLAGESWEGGPVILSWDAHRAADQGFNVVLHEFAHKIDMLDGSANGCPPLPSDVSPRLWARDFQSAYASLAAAVDSGLPVRVDEYAAESPAEFFAVMSEQFFLQPGIVELDFPPIYRHLCRFYRQDPATALARLNRRSP